MVGYKIYGMEKHTEVDKILTDFDRFGNRLRQDMLICVCVWCGAVCAWWMYMRRVRFCSVVARAPESPCFFLALSFIFGVRFHVVHRVGLVCHHHPRIDS